MSSVDGVTKGRFHGQEGESQQVEKASELVFCQNLTHVGPSMLPPGQRPTAFLGIEISD